jgi:hypothetical protein
VIALARSKIRSRDRELAAVWLSAAATAVVFLVVSQLFDVMSFPHAPYVFLSIAGLAATTARTPAELEADRKAELAA